MPPPPSAPIKGYWVSYYCVPALPWVLRLFMTGKVLAHGTHMLERTHELSKRASDHDKCQEDNWTGDISDRAGEGEERSSEGTGEPFVNELTIELRFKGWKAVIHTNRHCKLWEVQVRRPWGRNKGALFEEPKEAKWSKGQTKGGSWRDGVKEVNRVNDPLAHGRKVKPNEAKWTAQSLTAYYCYSSF